MAVAVIISCFKAAINFRHGDNFPQSHRGIPILGLFVHKTGEVSLLEIFISCIIIASALLVCLKKANRRNFALSIVLSDIKSDHFDHLNDPKHPIKRYFDGRRSNNSGRFLRLKKNKYKTFFTNPRYCRLFWQFLTTMISHWSGCACVSTSAEDDFQRLSKGGWGDVCTWWFDLRGFMFWSVRYITLFRARLALLGISFWSYCAMFVGEG